MADVAGVVSMFCHRPHDTATTVSPVSQRSPGASAPASDPPALPPRAPIRGKTLSGQSSRKPRARSSDPRSSGPRSSDAQSSGSVISPRTSSSELCADDTLDVFIPLSGDEQTSNDGLDLAVGVPDGAGRRNQLSSSSMLERTTSVSVSVERLENDEGCDGLDVVVGLDDEMQPTPDSSERTSFAEASSDRVRLLDVGNKVSAECLADSGRRVAEVSQRPRPTIGRRLTRKETTKLSRKLTRKMSCRQQHALMMASEFDEFDELDVVVEMGNATEDEDDDEDDDAGDRKLLATANVSEQKNDSETLQNVEPDIDSPDAGFDQRLTTRLHYDQLQVIPVLQ